MADVVFPQLSEDDPTAEGVLATWFVSDGDQVVSGQLLGEVMVDNPLALPDVKVRAAQPGTADLLTRGVTGRWGTGRSFGSDTQFASAVRGDIGIDVIAVLRLPRGGEERR